MAAEHELCSLIKMGMDLSHQLNNLLTAILVNTQIMLMIIQDDESKSYLGSVESAARDAANIVGKFQESVRAVAKLYPQADTSDSLQPFEAKRSG